MFPTIYSPCTSQFSKRQKMRNPLHSPQENCLPLLGEVENRVTPPPFETRTSYRSNQNSQDAMESPLPTSSDSLRRLQSLPTEFVSATVEALEAVSPFRKARSIPNLLLAPISNPILSPSMTLSSPDSTSSLLDEAPHTHSAKKLVLPPLLLSTPLSPLTGPSVTSSALPPSTTTSSTSGARETILDSDEKRRKYNTTSSIYLDCTLVNPNSSQVIFCISSVMQSQIFNDISIDRSLQAQHVVFLAFNIIPQLSPELGGWVTVLPEAVLEIEAVNDPVLRGHLISGTVPSVDTIFRFMSMLQDRAKFSTECNIIALVYLNRLTSAYPLAMTALNWRMLWTSCIILAQKMWDDNPLKSSSFATVLPGISRDRIRCLESTIFHVLDYNASVMPSVYTRYYFELRDLYHDIVGRMGGVHGGEWTLKPISLRESGRLEVRGTRCMKKKSPRGNTRSKLWGKSSSMSNCHMDAADDGSSKTMEDLSLLTQTRLVLS